MIKLKHVFLTYCLAMSTMAFTQKSIFDIARSGSVNDVKHLMQINPDTINSIAASGYSPLILACYNGNTQVAQFLAEHVTNINGTSKYGTPLMAAVYKNDSIITQKLLQLKANPNTADVNGTTPLHYAVIARNNALIKLLIAAGARTDAKDNRGNTAKDYALMTKSASIIEIIN